MAIADISDSIIFSNYAKICNDLNVSVLNFSIKLCILSCLNFLVIFYEQFSSVLPIKRSSQNMYERIMLSQKHGALNAWLRHKLKVYFHISLFCNLGSFCTDRTALLLQTPEITDRHTVWNTKST
jgi:hypothetical protein